MIEIREVNIEEIIDIHNGIPEFTIKAEKEYFDNRLKNKEHIIFAHILIILL